MTAPTSTRHPDLLHGSVTRNIVRLSLPLFVAMLFQTGFSFIDMIFVGMLSPMALAAVSMVFPVLFFFISFAMGVGVGLSSFVARSVGAGDLERAGRIAANGIVLSFVLSISLAVVGVLFSRQMFILLGAGPEILDMVLDYSRVVFIGFIVFFFAAFCNSIIRGEGDARSPMKFMMTATLLNLVLDPILIFGFGPVPRMEVEGAALAMIFSRLAMGVLALRHLLSGRSVVRPLFRGFRFEFMLVKEILRVGIPSTVTYMSSSIGLMIFMRLVSRHGPFAIAAYGIGGRVENIAILPAFGMAGAILTIVGQNYGAGNMDRARDTVKKGIGLIAGFMLLVALLSMGFAETLASLFTDNGQVIALGVDFIYLRALFWTFAGARMIVGAGFNGIGNPRVGLFSLLFGLFAVGLPTAVALGSRFGLDACWIGLSVSNLAGAGFAYRIFQRRFALPGAVTANDRPESADPAQWEETL